MMFVLPVLDAITKSAGSEDPQRADTFVMIYDQRGLPDGPLRFKQILSRIRKEVQHYPQFHRLFNASKIPFGDTRWVSDERFDAEFHVRHLALPKPGDWRQFCIQVARLHSRPLDINRPLWEINVVEGLDNIPWLGEGHFALVCKVHHALVDRAQLQDLMWTLHDEMESVARPAKRQHQITTFPLLSMLNDNLAKALSPLDSSVRQTSKLVHEAKEKLAPAIGFYSRALFQEMNVPYTRFNTDVSDYRVWESCSFPLDKVRQIQSRFPEATQEDLLLALISGALNLYLKDKTELSARGLSIISSSTTSGICEGETVLSLDVYGLAVQSNDPAERVKLITGQRHAVNTENCGGHDSWSETSATPVSPMQHMALASNQLQRVQRKQSGVPMANTALVNVAGTEQPLSLLGAPLVYFSGVSEITDGLGLVHLATSHNQRLNLSVTSCREMLPDPGYYRDCIERSFDDLLAAEPYRKSEKDHAHV